MWVGLEVCNTRCEVVSCDIYAWYYIQFSKCRVVQLVVETQYVGVVVVYGVRKGGGGTVDGVPGRVRSGRCDVRQEVTLSDCYRLGLFPTPTAV